MSQPLVEVPTIRLPVVVDNPTNSTKLGDKLILFPDTLTPAVEVAKDEKNDGVIQAILFGAVEEAYKNWPSVPIAKVEKPLVEVPTMRLPVVVDNPRKLIKLRDKLILFPDTLTPAVEVAKEDKNGVVTQAILFGAVEEA